MLWLAGGAVDAGHQDFLRPKMVASMSVDYFSPVEYGSPLLVALSVTRIGTKSYTLRHDGSQGGQTRFSGIVVLVPRNAESGRARTVTESERAYLTRYLPIPTS